jgi:hypothetical protein
VNSKTRTAQPLRSRPEDASGAGSITHRTTAGSLWLEVLLLAAIALAVRLIYLDHAPYIDELYHALAARSLLDDGTLHINGERPYTRAWALTYVVAGLFWFFGDSLVVGRIPAVVAGIALVVALFLWLRSVATGAAAWIAAILLCFAPISIYLSQQVRFYTLHAFFFWLGAFAVYAASTSAPRRNRRTAWLAAGAGACFVVAFHLQPITAVGVAALALWLALRHGPDFVRWLAAGGRRRMLLAAGGLLAGAALLVVAWRRHARDARPRHDGACGRLVCRCHRRPLVLLQEPRRPVPDALDAVAGGRAHRRVAVPHAHPVPGHHIRHRIRVPLGRCLETRALPLLRAACLFRDVGARRDRGAALAAAAVRRTQRRHAPAAAHSNRPVRVDPGRRGTVGGRGEHRHRVHVPDADDQRRGVAAQPGVSRGGRLAGGLADPCGRRRMRPTSSSRPPC